MSESILFITVRADHGGGPKHLLVLIQECQMQWPELNISVASPLETPYGPIFQKLADQHIEIPHRSFSLKAWWRLWCQARDQKIRIVHSHGRGAGMYSRLLKLVLPCVKVVHTFHGFHRSPGIIGRVKLAVDQVLASFADHYIAVSESEKDLLEKNACLGSVPTSVIMNGVKIQQLHPAKEFRNRFGMMARLDHAKGVDILLKHLESFHDGDPERAWQFYLAGFPTNQIVVPPKLQKRLVLMGEVPSSNEFFEKIDIFVSTSRWEGFPLVVLEAMAYGIPSVLSFVPGNSYFIQHQIAQGFHLEKPEELVGALQALSADAQRREALARAAFAYVSENHRLQSMAARTFDIYREASVH